MASLNFKSVVTVVNIKLCTFTASLLHCIKCCIFEIRVSVMIAGLKMAITTVLSISCLLSYILGYTTRRMLAITFY